MFKDLFDNLKQAEIQYERLERKCQQTLKSAEYWENKFNEVRKNPTKYAPQQTVSPDAQSRCSCGSKFFINTGNGSACYACGKSRR